MLIMTPFMYKKLELITPWLLSSFRETKWQIPFSRALFISMFFHHWSSAVKCFWMHWRFNNVCNTWAKITFQTDPHMTPAKELDLSLWDKKFWLEIINLIRGLPDTFFNKSNKYCFDGSCGNDQPNDKDSLKKKLEGNITNQMCVFMKQSLFFFLGKPVSPDSNEFPENFRTAFGPPPPPLFRKISLRFFPQIHYQNYRF